MSEHLLIDLRSDTVTRPSPGMRKAMVEAEVGDDVLGDDPTVIKLQERIADVLGKEAAIFVPSGSMANQAAIRAQTEASDEILCHEDSHIYHYEAGAFAGISGCSLRLLPGRAGQFTAEQARVAVRPKESHFPQTRLVVIENTHNRGGGSIWPVETVAEIHEFARRSGLRMHLDGARLMNACVALGLPPTVYTKYFDTVSTCFSKGLGAPVGSAVAGTKDTIKRVHRFRKMLGGGMRQAGILAAAALYALENNVERLTEDHDHAQRLARAIADMDGLTINVSAVETNILYFDVDPQFGTAAALCDGLRQRGVLMMATGPQRIRAVTHLDVSSKDIDEAVRILGELVKDLRGRIGRRAGTDVLTH